MSPHRTPSFAVILAYVVGLLGLLVSPARAQDPARLAPLPHPGDEVAWYVVQEGDTLEEITGRTLGVASLWPENHRLNPTIRDPDRLRIGQRIRIITSRAPAAREAEVTLVSRVVKTQRFPGRQEEDAYVGTRLQERDGVRTAESSSAELTFEAERKLFIGERSLVFLERVDSTLTGVQRDSIEIRQGMAEVTDRPKGKHRSEIEIIVGDARARLQPSAGEAAQTRASRPADGGARVMVYGGRSEVEAGGETVEVPQGMGTAVPEDGPPAPPEKLLRAPTALTPAVRQTFDFSNPRFRWQPVTGAVAYVAEVCADRECSALVRRQEALADTLWEPETLPEGALFWRVTAVAESGLDGYPSEPRPFEIASARPDLLPPAVAAALVGPGTTEQEGDSAQAVLGAQGRLELHAADDVSGVAAVQYRWAAGDWRTYGGELLEPPAGSGPHRLEARAEDHRGRVSEPWTLEVQRTATAPEAPEVRWRP